MDLKDKQKNVADMMTSLRNLATDLKDDPKLEADFVRFIHVFIMSTIDFEALIRVIDNKIQNARLSKNTTANGLTNKATANFWNKVRDVIFETYKKNKEK